MERCLWAYCWKRTRGGYDETVLRHWRPFVKYRMEVQALDSSGVPFGKVERKEGGTFPNSDRTLPVAKVRPHRDGTVYTSPYYKVCENTGSIRIWVELDKPWPNEITMDWEVWDVDKHLAVYGAYVRPEGDVKEGRGNLVFPAGYRRGYVDIVIPDNEVLDWPADKPMDSNGRWRLTLWHGRNVDFGESGSSRMDLDFHTVDDEHPVYNDWRSSRGCVDGWA